MIRRIAHVCLNVRDLKASLEYYTALGCTLKFKFTRANAALIIYPTQTIGRGYNMDWQPGMTIHLIDHLVP